MNGRRITELINVDMLSLSKTASVKYVNCDSLINPTLLLVDDVPDKSCKFVPVGAGKF